MTVTPPNNVRTPPRKWQLAMTLAFLIAGIYFASWLYGADLLPQVIGGIVGALVGFVLDVAREPTLRSLFRRGG